MTLADKLKENLENERIAAELAVANAARQRKIQYNKEDAELKAYFMGKLAKKIQADIEAGKTKLNYSLVIFDFLRYSNGMRDHTYPSVKTFFQFLDDQGLQANFVDRTHFFENMKIPLYEMEIKIK